MATLIFKNFHDARDTARFCAMRFEVETRITINNSSFAVHFPDKLQIKDIKEFKRMCYPLGIIPNSNFLSLLAYVDKSIASSQALAWRDSNNGLAWDVARLFYSDRQTELPEDGKELMNAIEYAGLTHWRLPSLDELRTLNTTKLNSLGISSKGKPSLRFWSSNKSKYSTSENAFLDIESKIVGHQYFIEHHRDRQSYGDGYTEYAQTMMVCSLD